MLLTAGSVLYSRALVLTHVAKLKPRTLWEGDLFLSDFSCATEGLIEEQKAKVILPLCRTNIVEIKLFFWLTLLILWTYSYQAKECPTLLCRHLFSDWKAWLPLADHVGCFLWRSHLQLETNKAIMKELTKTIESYLRREERNKENQADHKAHLTRDWLQCIKFFFSFAFTHNLPNCRLFPPYIPTYFEVQSSQFSSIYKHYFLQMHMAGYDSLISESVTGINSTSGLQIFF